MNPLSLVLALAGIVPVLDVAKAARPCRATMAQAIPRGCGEVTGHAGRLTRWFVVDVGSDEAGPPHR